ncbi:hypothetical protein VHUM_02998 [Vanrija humicola]|uniref:C2H2-type domain-containing protein n=1 Tax=Vanrija humicola TaxID=5417 RepID=A0A7D8UZ23_VANHU|nr:hypothetical protein VHUM_02998 [Vanrija humicola]
MSTPVWQQHYCPPPYYYAHYPHPHPHPHQLYQQPAELPVQSSPAANPKASLLHPSFLPPCEHGKEGEMHAHAFDLLSLAGGPKTSTPPKTPNGAEVAGSVPATSYLSTTRPAAVNGTAATTNGSAAPPVTASPAAKPRRMSSSTTGVLGRGKLGLMGDSGLEKLARPTLSSSYSSGATPIPGRRLSSATGSPQLFDFAKTDRRPATVRANSRTTIAASLPSRGIAGAPGRVQAAPTVQADDMELDMEFDGDDDDDDRSGGRSGSAELDMDMEDEAEPADELKPEWEKLALGTGSGGIKGRRKGMVFKCESCSKEYRHPSCLVKHRWEHSPHWREPTQISMSKHQQVQMLEAAAILAHMDPTNAQGRSLPTDKSLWPAILSPRGDNALLKSARSAARDLPKVSHSPAGSTVPPLTPSSLRDSSTFGNVKDRKSSPGSDSTSSDGFTQSGLSPAPSSLGLKANGHSKPVGINGDGRRSSVSSAPGPGTPHSAGSLPDMAGLHFYTGTTPVGTSPLPNRGLPLSLTARAGMIGGGMFGRNATNFKVPDSGLRGGVAEDDEDDDLSFGLGGRGKSSSEEADERRREDDTGFEIENMDL